MNEVLIENISKSFGERKVLCGFSARLMPGKLYRLSAPSGAGKTTLLRIILGLENADSGSISGIPQRIGAVFQEDRLAANLTVRENIGLVLPGRSDPEKLNGHLHELGLDGCSEKKISELSGGMKRRAALLRAVLYPCDMLILDEPFTGLDENAVSLTVKYILNHLNGRTCIIAGHISDELLNKSSELIKFS